MTGSNSKPHRLRKVLVVLVVLTMGGFAAAVFLAGGFREFGASDPKRVDYAGLRSELSNAEDLTERTFREARRSGNLAAATALKQAILSSRASARSTGTQPIPQRIREQLQDYFPQDVLDEVRWAFPNSYLDLGSLVAWYKAEGGAVTLQDTIVYASRVGVESEYLWAHELTHVMQYKELGLEDFARVYATHPHLLEQQARDNANRIVRDIRRRRKAAPPPPTANAGVVRRRGAAGELDEDTHGARAERRPAITRRIGPSVNCCGLGRNAAPG